MRFPWPEPPEPIADPLNPRPGSGLFGDVSWFSMPAWDEPDFLEEAEPARRGRLERIEWESQVREGQKQVADVYLPAGYDSDPSRRFPVAYIHHAQEALDDGKLENALDQLIGRSIEPLIAVFVLPDEEDPRGDLGERESYAEMIITALVQRIDGRYRTIADPLARASIGSGRGANVALYIAFKHPEVFARVGGQSATVGAGEIMELPGASGDRSMVIYLDWGTYHLRSPHEAWDLAAENRKLWARLRQAGLRPAGGERPEGFGWACWKAHTDELFGALFPKLR